MFSCCFCPGRKKDESQTVVRERSGLEVGLDPCTGKDPSDAHEKEFSPLRETAEGGEESIIDASPDHPRGEDTLAVDDGCREGLISLKPLDDPSGNKQRVELLPSPMNGRVNTVPSLSQPKALRSSGLLAVAQMLPTPLVSFCTVGTFRADLLGNLERSSDELVEIAAQFVERAIRMHIVTVYEGRPVGTSVGPVVVGRASTVMNLPNERLIPHPTHDSNMIRESVVVEDSDIKACLDMLHFPEYRARRSNVSPAHHSTFDWIWKHPKYRQWERSRTSFLMWLQGKPRSGKSTLANFVRSCVGSRVGSSNSGRQTIVVDFYSARGGSRQNQHFWMLRSILYQFLLQVPGLWGNYRENFKHWKAARAGAHNPDEHPNLRLTAYVLIDALDESEEVRRQDIIELLRVVARRDSSWPIDFKIFLTSRPSPKIEQSLRGVDTIVLENETGSDIVNFVQSETKRIANDILDCDAEELSFISTYLIKASNGVFLWVKLVLDQLDERATDGFCSVAELEKLLLSIPRDLREAYRLGTNSTSLRQEMASVVELLKPLLVEALARGDDHSLDRLILHKDQTNSHYPVPKNDSRFHQEMIRSSMVLDNFDQVGLLQLAILRSGSEETTQKKTLAVLCNRGADPNLQDVAGSTALHTAVKIQGWVRDRLKDAIEELISPRILDGFLSLAKRALCFYEEDRKLHTGNLDQPIPYDWRSDKHIMDLQKLCILISSVARGGHNIFGSVDVFGTKLTRRDIWLALQRLQSVVIGSKIRRDAIWSLLWSIKSFQQRLVDHLLNFLERPEKFKELLKLLQTILLRPRHNTPAQGPQGGP
ncbi:hypothetical protein QBC38DRAFT_451252 [Podospora fimiseda]|uniref:Nephrocystin 3-like N-terminal domain-containing protein n=1 Tax=Podospora fimiseda TaxID=252190 RepID=A0AAN7BYG8_9PEZI|nr:hypothetical protein QBC38DRAFT_451252 [Podospora fimiseda]